MQAIKISGKVREKRKSTGKIREMKGRGREDAEEKEEGGKEC